jgi:hypothetical protein
MTHKIVRHIKINKALGVKLEGDAKKVDDFFNSLFDGLEECESHKYPGDIFFRKNDKTYMWQDTKNEKLWCSYKYIWSFFESEFGYKDNEISNLIQGMVELHLKRKVFTVNFSLGYLMHIGGTTFKTKGIAPTLGFH